MVASLGRYRCITQQFFRKVDGIIIVYDLTAKESFLSVRQWLSSIEVSRPLLATACPLPCPSSSGSHLSRTKQKQVFVYLCM